ncbi:hypothetical protein PENTCL1PPCAC_14701, partial [Pristionchus entomophagus]
PLCAFNPVLRNGTKGLPGVRARINERMFRYASQLVGEMLSREIQNARLPEIYQSMQPLIDGNFVLFNAYVTRYRCPQRVVVVPKTPNRLVLQLQNYDVGINANVAGHINMMVPMAAESILPSGVLQFDVRGLYLEVQIAVDLEPRGPEIYVTSCTNYIDKVDISMEKAGPNARHTLAFLRRFVSNFVRDLLPDEICKMVPRIVDQQINLRFSSIPQVVALTQLAMLTGLGLFSATPKVDPTFCAQQCGLDIASNVTKHVAARSISTASPRKKGIVSAPWMHPLCSQCAISDDESASLLQGFAKNLNLRKMKDMFISVKMLNSYASDDGFTVDLTGEFSPGGQGGTPFGLFPIYFPGPRNEHMAEVLVSDFAINSLLYWAHRKGFINFRVGPETPKIGDILKTTCSDDDD